MNGFKEFLQLKEYAGDHSTSLDPSAAFNWKPGQGTIPSGLGNIPGTHNDGNRSGNAGAYMTSDQTGSEQRRKTLQNQPHHPSYDLTISTLPSVQVNGTVRDIDWFSNANKSSIGLTVSMPNHQTTRLNLTRDQWDRMKDLNNGAEPKQGNNITVLMQRHPTDLRQTPSKVLGIKY
jgi:hypothetical protein